MGDDGNDAKTSQFAALTGAPAETAAFYLDSCNGDVQAAINAYYTNAEAPPPAAQTFLPPKPNVREEEGSGGDGEAVGSGKGAARQGQGQAQGRPTGGGRGGGNIRGFSDLGGSGGDDDEDDDNDDIEYYAGGEKSGVAVKGGGKKEKVDGLFDSARKHGAVEGTEQDLQPRDDSMRAFTGTARTLSGGEREPEEQEDVSEQSHTITFYENDIFVVNDGEPREILDPANAEFINAIGKGECPSELFPKDGRPVNVNLVRKETKYTPPEKPKYVAFAGQGLSLAEGSGPSGTVASAGASVVPGAEWEGPNESEPTTSLQIRMHDGSRTVARFNHTHTVLDIRRFIAAVRPDMPLAYSLMTSFPSAQLTDDSVTLEAAGLLNAVIIQKL